MNVNIIVYSTANQSKEVLKQIDSINNKYPILLLTPTITFCNEKGELINNKKKLIFRSFYEFLDQDDMIKIDSLAYKTTITNKTKNNLNYYFQNIRITKNYLIKERIFNEYEVKSCSVLADDQGIVPEVWSEEAKPKKLKKTRQCIKIPKISLLKFSKVSFLGKNYMLFYSGNRIYNYLDESKFTEKKPSYLNLIFFNTVRLFSNKFPNIISINKLIIDNNLDGFLVSIHDYYSYISKLSKETKVCLNILQDCYLPENYSSKYLNYYFNVNSFFTWDKLSMKLFNNHGHKSETFKIYKRIKFKTPEIKIQNEKIKVLYIASGSGDWTAQKNRSDEDLVFLGLIQMAKIFPEFNFIYRPHPYWLHKNHQGRNSIKRLIKFVQYLSLKNFVVSQNIEKDSNQFKKLNNTSKSFSSLSSEIDSCDLVMGDHSQSLVNAAASGKIIASINFSNRESFFIGFSKLGFPLLRNKAQLECFLKDFKCPKMRKKMCNKQLVAISNYIQFN